MKSPVISERKEDNSQKWLLTKTSLSEEEFLTGISKAEE